MTNKMKLIGLLILPGLLSACAGSFSPSEQIEPDGVKRAGVDASAEVGTESEKVKKSMKLYVYEGSVASKETSQTEGARKGYFVEFALNSGTAPGSKPATVIYQD